MVNQNKKKKNSAKSILVLPITNIMSNQTSGPAQVTSVSKASASSSIFFSVSAQESNSQMS